MNITTSYSNNVGIPLKESNGINKALQNSNAQPFNVETNIDLELGGRLGLGTPSTPEVEYKNRGEEVSSFVQENMKPSKAVEETEKSEDNTLTYNPDGSYTLTPLDSTISITV